MLLRRTFISLIIIILAGYSSFAQNAMFDWAIENGSPDISDTHADISGKEAGGFIQSGEFADTASFGSFNLIAAGGTDIYLVSYDEQGVPEWAITIGGTDNEYVEEISSDENGNIYLAGYFYGTMQIGGEMVVSQGSQDVFVAKYDQSGNFLWVRTAGGMMADHVKGLTLVNNENPLITGYFYSPLTIGDTVLNSYGSSDIFMVEYTNLGDPTWIEQIGGASSEQVSSVASGPSGDVLITGLFYNDIAIGDTVLTTSESSGIFYSSYSAGNFSWARQLDGTGLGLYPRIAATGDGTFFIAGGFSEEITLGNQTFNAGEFNTDVFTAYCNAEGEVLWACHGHSDADDDLVDIEVSPTGSALITGHFMLDFSMGDVELIYTLCCGSREVYVMEITPQGKAAWGKQISGERANVSDMAALSDGRLLTSGFFLGEVLFDSLALNSGVDYRNFVDCISYETAVGTGRHMIMDYERLVYPNPSRGDVFVNSSLAGEEVMIFDLQGRLMKQFRLKKGGRIETGDLPAGTYIMSFPGKSLRIKFIRTL